MPHLTTDDVLSSTGLHQRLMLLQARLLTQGVPDAPGAWGRVSALLSSDSVLHTVLVAGFAGAVLALVACGVRLLERRQCPAPCA